MYQSKSRGKMFPVDMFPMVNLLLIILLFLVVTMRPRVPCPIDIDLPAGHYFNTADHDGNYITILQSHGKVMLRTGDSATRREALSLMGDIYHTSFTPPELLNFSKTDIIGTPVAGLKKYITNYYNPADYYAQKGIPVAQGDELFNWIKCLRMAAFKHNGFSAHLNIEADKETPYPVIKNIIELLHKQKVNKFMIVYSFVWEN